MNVANLTYDERRRFHRCQVCPICNKFIEDYDSFESISVKKGRMKIYTFLHTKCIIGFHENVLHDKMEDELWLKQ